jgi:hypothetical protein
MFGETLILYAVLLFVAKKFEKKYQGLVEKWGKFIFFSTRLSLRVSGFILSLILLKIMSKGYGLDRAKQYKKYSPPQ